MKPEGEKLLDEPRFKLRYNDAAKLQFDYSYVRPDAISVRLIQTMVAVDHPLGSIGEFGYMYCICATWAAEDVAKFWILFDAIFESFWFID